MSLGQNQRLVCAAFLLHKDAEDLIVPEASSPCLHRQSAEGWEARMWRCSVWDYPTSNLSQQRWISWPGGAHSHRAASVVSPCSWLLCRKPQAGTGSALCFCSLWDHNQCLSPMWMPKLCFPQWEEMQELPLSAPPGSTVRAPGPALSTLNISCMSLDLSGCSQPWRRHQSC